MRKQKNKNCPKILKKTGLFHYPTTCSWSVLNSCQNELTHNVVAEYRNTQIKPSNFYQVSSVGKEQPFWICSPGTRQIQMEKKTT
jgi:hypothetical protein